jgi:intein-encoded DNA endonuclease-like protein
MSAKRIFTRDEINLAIKLYNDGKSIKEIMNVLHTSQNLIRKILVDNNIIVRKRAEHTKKYTCDYDFFETIDSEEKAYWLGFLYADGNVLFIHRGNKIRTGRIVLKLKRDDENHIFKFKEAIKGTYPVRQLTQKSKERDIEYKLSLIQIDNIKMVNDLIDKGCIPKKSLKLSFPEKIPIELYRHFIRGYFDGDGCVCFKIYEYKKLFEVTILGTYNFLFKLKTILESNEIKCRKINKHSSNIYNLKISGFDNLHKLFNYFYSNSNVYLERKFNKFQEALKSLNKI